MATDGYAPGDDAAGGLLVQIAQADRGPDEAFELLLRRERLGDGQPLPHRGTRDNELHPSLQVRIFREPDVGHHRELGRGRDPREICDVGDGEFVTGEVGLTLEARVQHAEDAGGLLEVAVADLREFVLPGTAEDQELAEHRSLATTSG